MSEKEFVRFWNKAKSVQEIADELGILPVSASVRASIYRRKGLKLKKFSTARKAA